MIVEMCYVEKQLILCVLFSWEQWIICKHEYTTGLSILVWFLPRLAFVHLLWCHYDNTSVAVIINYWLILLFDMVVQRQQCCHFHCVCLLKTMLVLCAFILAPSQLTDAELIPCSHQPLCSSGFHHADPLWHASSVRVGIWFITCLWHAAVLAYIATLPSLISQVFAETERDSYSVSYWFNVKWTKLEISGYLTYAWSLERSLLQKLSETRPVQCLVSI